MENNEGGQQRRFRFQDLHHFKNHLFTKCKESIISTILDNPDSTLNIEVEFRIGSWDDLGFQNNVIFSFLFLMLISIP